MEKDFGQPEESKSRRDGLDTGPIEIVKPEERRLSPMGGRWASVPRTLRFDENLRPVEWRTDLNEEDLKE